MSKVIIFSTKFPSYHPKVGQSTYFLEKIWHGLNWSPPSLSNWSPLSLSNFGFKYTTIRAGNRWKVGDKFSPRIWGNDINHKSGRKGPYHSKQIIIAPDIEIKKVWAFEIKCDERGEKFYINKTLVSESDNYMLQWFNSGLITEIAKNDGLELVDFLAWFKYPKPFKGQIICWDENINY